jgi:lysophospholipase L1-like esterase
MQFLENCKLLVIGDYFLKRCENIMKTRYQQVDFKIIAIGDKTEEIIALYNSERQSAQDFRPTHIILHEGHNEMAFHPTKNPLPEISRDVVANSISFGLILQLHHPQAEVMISATFPRCHKKYSILSKAGVVDFNTKMKRHGQRIRTMAERNHLGYILNNFSWGKISQCLEKPDYYLEDGFHFNSTGMHAQAKEWLQQLAIPGPTPSN